MFTKIKSIETPTSFKESYPLPADHAKIKQQRDQMLCDIFTGKDIRLVLFIGPCSADHADSLCDYVCRLAALQEQVADSLLLVPRIYTNKPRTNGKGYKGMLHQPDPEGVPSISNGMVATRKLHLRAIAESHLTAADEMLYPENVLYFDDLLSYHAIGARSVENQQHRLAASGIDAPVGMKNPTSGHLAVMFNAMVAAQASHNFLYRGQEVSTTGNPMAHAILRGYVNSHGESKPNYHYEYLREVLALYKNTDLENPAVIVDVNHANSNKQHREQPRIAKEVLHARRYDTELKQLVKGLMIESYIEEGTQPLSGNVYGKSITDPCLGWEDSKRLVLEIAEIVAKT